MATYKLSSPIRLAALRSLAELDDAPTEKELADRIGVADGALRDVLRRALRCRWVIRARFTKQSGTATISFYRYMITDVGRAWLAQQEEN